MLAVSRRIQIGSDCERGPHFYRQEQGGGAESIASAVPRAPGRTVMADQTNLLIHPPRFPARSVCLEGPPKQPENTDFIDSRLVSGPELSSPHPVAVVSPVLCFAKDSFAQVPVTSRNVSESRQSKLAPFLRSSNSSRFLEAQTSGMKEDVLSSTRPPLPPPPPPLPTP